MTEIGCAICGRIIPYRYKEKHHLVPKSRDGEETVAVCRDCGTQMHMLFSNRELGEDYNTIELLKSNSDVQKWIKWISKRPFGFKMRESRRKR